MENRNENMKIKSFERLFRSLKDRRDEKADLREELASAEFCRDVRKILEETERVLIEGRYAELSGQRIVLTEKADMQNIVLAGPIGMGGTVLLARYFREELSRVFPDWVLREATEMEAQMQLYPSGELLEQCGVMAAFSVGEGGLNRTLFQLGKSTGRGYEIQARYVPVNQITIEFCEYFDLNPWSLLSAGCVLLICSQTSKLLQELNRTEIPAAVIGFMTDQKEKVITYGAARSLINRPKADALLVQWLRGREKTE